MFLIAMCYCINIFLTNFLFETENEEILKIMRNIRKRKKCDRKKYKKRKTNNIKRNN